MLEEGLLREEQGAYSEALRWYTRGEKALPAIDDDVARGRLQIALMRARAQARFRQGRYDGSPRPRGAGGRTGRRPGRPRRPCARVLPQPRHPHAARRSRAPCLPRACAADLRGDRRSRRPGQRAQQPRDRGLLRGPLGRGARSLRAQPEPARADRRRDQRGHDDQQHRRDRARPGTLRRRRGALPRRASHRRLRRASADLGRLAREPQPPRRALRPLHGRRRAAHRRPRDTRRDRLGPVPARVPGAPRGVADPERRRPGRGGQVGGGDARARRRARADARPCRRCWNASAPPASRGARTCPRRARRCSARSRSPKSAQADYESALALRALASLEGARADETATAIFARLGVDESALPQL